MADRDVNSVILIGLDGEPYEVGASSGGVSQQDDTAFEAGADSGTPVQGLYESSVSALTDGNVGVLGATAQRALKVTLFDTNGSEVSVSGGTQYTEGDTDASITGTAMLMEVGSDTLQPVQGTVAGGLLVNLGSNNDVVAAGDVAANAADSGNPLKVGGVYNATKPTYDDGDRTDLGSDSRGNLRAALYVQDSATPILNGSMSADGVTPATGGALRVQAGLLVLNGSSTYDRVRGDTTNGLDVDVTRVQGTVAVDGSGVTQPISHAALTELAAAIDTEVQVDIVGSLPAGTNTIGKLAANSGVDIGDVDVTSLPALAAGTNLIGIAAVAHNDSYYQGTTSRTIGRAIIDAATSGNNTLLAAQGASNKIRVHSVFLVAAGAVTARFESGVDGTALTGQMNLAANGGFVLPFNPYGWFETAANTLLNLELGGSVSVDGAFQYSVVQ